MLKMLLVLLSNVKKIIGIFAFCLLCFCVCGIQKCYAYSIDYPAPYQDCVYGFETELKLYGYILVRPVGDACYNDCNNKCRSIFNLGTSDDGKSDLTKNPDYIVYLNRDLVEQCMQSCVMGATTSFDVRGPISKNNDTDNPFYPFYIESQNVQLKQSNCNNGDIADPQSAMYPYVYRSQNVYENQVVEIKIVDNNKSNSTINNLSTNGDLLTDTPINEVYLCGYKSLFIFPDFATTENCITKGITGCDSRKCLTVTDCKNKDSNDPWSANYPFLGDANKWYARNASWYDTGMTVRDGDLLSVKYYGSFLHSCHFDQALCDNPGNNYYGSTDDNLLVLANPAARGNNMWDSCIFDSKGKCEPNDDGLGNSASIPLFNTGNNGENGLSISKHVFNTGGNPISILNFDSDKVDDSNFSSDTAKASVKAGVDDDTKRNSAAILNIESDPRTVLDPDSGYPKMDNLIDIFMTNAQFGYTDFHKMRPTENFIYNKKAYVVNFAHGNIKNFSRSSARLGIKHYDGGPASNWSDNVGGYNVELSWKGCRFNNGEMLQYTIVPAAYAEPNSPYLQEYRKFLNDDSKWKDLIFDKETNTASININKGDIPSLPGVQAQADSDDDDDNGGYLIFRVNLLHGSNDPKVVKKGWVSTTSCPDPLKYPKSHSMCLTEQAFFDSDAIERHNTIGGYMLRVEVKPQDSGDKDKCNNFLCSLILKINQQLFEGDPNGQTEADREGIARAIYENVVAADAFLNIIRALILLYIAMTGLVFMIGLSPITQKEGIIRIFKLSLVLILISDNSWAFFSFYIFNFVIQGMRDLIVIFTYYLGDTQPGIDYMPILGLLYDLIDITWSPLTWNKIEGLLLASLGSYDQDAIMSMLITGYYLPKITLMTLFLAIILIIGCIFSTMAILRSLLVYLLSLFIITIMIITAPLFLSFMLFSVTKEMFNAWLKQFLLSLMEPVLTFAAVSVFATIYLIVFKAVISYTACSECFLGIDLSIWQMCLVQIYYPLFTLHTPGPFYVPLLFLSEAVAVAILAHSMYVMVDLVSSLCELIIQFGSLSVARMGQFTSLMKPATDPISMARSVVVGDILGLEDTEYRKKQQEDLKEEWEEKEKEREEKEDENENNENNNN